MDLSEIINPKSSSDSSEEIKSSDAASIRLPEHSILIQDNPNLPSRDTEPNIHEEHSETQFSSTSDLPHVQPSSPPPPIGGHKGEHGYFDNPDPGSGPGPGPSSHPQTATPAHPEPSSISPSMRVRESSESIRPRRSRWRTSRSLSAPTDVLTHSINVQARTYSSGSSGNTPSSSESKGLKFQEPLLTPLTFVNTSSEGPLFSQVRTKGPNSTWTLEEERMLIDMIMDTLPPFDFAKIAAILQKSDAECVRQRWEYLVKRAKRLEEDEGGAGDSNSDESDEAGDTHHSGKEPSPYQSKGKETM